MDTILISRNKDTKHMNVDQRLVIHFLHLDLKVITKIVTNIDIEFKNANPRYNLIEYSRSKAMHLSKVIHITRITKHGKTFIIVVSMVMV